jgi:hypothetical protein
VGCVRRGTQEVTVTRVASGCNTGHWSTETFATPLLLRETNSDVHLKVRYSQLVVSMGESRTELIAWLNELLSLNYTKVEQCGTGGAYCQIMDSVYGKLAELVRLRRVFMPCILGDVQMARVKMNAKHEYEFIANFKVLQNIFKAKKIDRVRIHPIAVR